MSGDSASRKTLGDLGEEALVARLCAMVPSAAGVVAGPGDDCAVVEGEGGSWELLKTDSVIEGVHFSPGSDPRLVGRKAINRVLSDLAAMGGTPRHALVSLALDEGRAETEVRGWYEGILAAAALHGAAVVGGETSRLPGPGAVLTVAMTGSVRPDRCVFRTGARPGDIVAVTGRLGGSFQSGRHLDFVPRLREGRWLAARAKPTAMMDLSDGLGSDLPRLAAASGIGFRIDLERLPRHPGITPEQACGEGEDYELLATFAPEVFAALLPEWAETFPDLSLTAIGEMTESDFTPLPRGWEHYRAR